VSDEQARPRIPPSPREAVLLRQLRDLERRVGQLEREQKETARQVAKLRKGAR
jgi:cell division protein FtsB